jgi:DNA-binding Lrp family transcriptional regulator
VALKQRKRAEYEVRDQAEVNDFDRRVYRAIARYAPDEPACCPSQQLIAHDVGCARESVNRSVQRLVKAGWLAIRKRWSYRSKWCHNVYELLEPFAVSVLAMKRISRRAHRRARRASRNPFRRLDHTNPKGMGLGRCGCRSCRPDESWRTQPPRRALLPEALRRQESEWRLVETVRAKYGREQAARMLALVG